MHAATRCAMVLGLAANTAFAAAAKPPAGAAAFATIGGRGYAPFYSYVITPHAVVAKGVVYCAFQNELGRPIVMAYDVKAKTWAGPVVASSFGLGSDAHGNPSLYVDRRGHVHLFYGCHGGRMRHTRSVQPLDITAWREQPPPTPRATYPQSMRLTDGTMCLLYRAGGHKEPWTLRTSTDDCKTWGRGERIIEMRLAPRDPQAAAYAFFFPGTDGRTIHCFWNHKDDNPGRINRGRMKKHPWRPLKYKGLHEAVYRYNMYYIRREANGKWVNVAGETMKLPIGKVLADAKCMLFDSGDEFAYPSRLADDAQNRPYIRIRTGVGDWTSKAKPIVPFRNKYAAARDGKWRVADSLPADWPASVRAVIGQVGLAAYGRAEEGNWYIYRKSIKPTGTAIYLYNDTTGPAARKGGPADCSGMTGEKPAP